MVLRINKIYVSFFSVNLLITELTYSYPHTLKLYPIEEGLPLWTL